MRALLVLFSLMLSMSLSAAEKLQVVTSFSILADMVHQVGGEHIQITNMVGPDADAHTYEPTPDDAKALLKAKLVIKNGLGFEPWLDRLVTSTDSRGADCNNASTNVRQRSCRCSQLSSTNNPCQFDRTSSEVPTSRCRTRLK